ncbi:MAG: hypothetical protein LBJ59_02865, partial [Zoogloeaceae bacterium]|nr:hypothetical protein [Zoogloeaceae bacterium]
QGNHLEVVLLGTEGDKITFENWYANTNYQIEEFRLSDGALLKNTDVQTLVNAMQNETPPDYGAADYPEDLLEIIGAQWETPEGEVLL